MMNRFFGVFGSGLDKDGGSDMSRVTSGELDYDPHKIIKFSVEKTRRTWQWILSQQVDQWHWQGMA